MSTVLSVVYHDRTASSLESSCANVLLIGPSPHDTQLISKAVRSYLNLEWQHKLDEDVSRSVPLVWAKEHPGMSPYFGRHTMPGVVANVPSQNNKYDCGLFVLTYMDFWTCSPPHLVNFSKEGQLKGKHLCFCYACTLCTSVNCVGEQGTDVSWVCILAA